MQSNRLRIAIQKKGRLNQDALRLLKRCGIKVQLRDNALFCHAENLPIDLLFVRDDDIPTLIMDAVCDLGIVGENVLHEQALKQQTNGNGAAFSLIKKLGFGRCRLSIALPAGQPFNGPKSLQDLRIATTYPNLLNQYLHNNKVKAQSVTIAGSVEIAPRLDIADAICDLISTGRTLEENNLTEVAEVIQSEAVLIRSQAPFNTDKTQTLELLLRRIKGVLRAEESKYIMFHAPKAALDTIKTLLPGSETPSIMPLEGSQDKVAVHLVSPEGVFWSTLEKLKNAGASAILVLPIEKMLA